MNRNTGSKVRQIQIITPEEELENLRNEVGALKRTVESKSAAVNILRAELQECQKERDKFRTLVEDETLHRSSVSSVSKKAAYSDPCRSAMLSGSEGTLAQLLSLSKDENKTLRLESTELRCKLHDAQADIKVLREEIQRLKGTEGRRRSLVYTATSQLAHQEREQFISQMEVLSSKCQALEGDVRGLVEEREELVRELDASSHKLHRLNHILNTILSSSSSSSHHPKRVIDLDAIITENRYLQERVKQTEEEKSLAKSNASKYKAALEKSRTQGSIKLGSSDNLIVTPKQVSELLRDYRGEVDGAAETDLKSLCVALVDALNQRSRALRAQRSANKVLVGRVTDLERRLSSSGNVDDTTPDNHGNTDGDNILPQVNSLSLMEGYIPPSGPIPKYSEEDTMKDPRLIHLLKPGIRNSTSVGKDFEVSMGNNYQANTDCTIKSCSNSKESEERSISVNEVISNSYEGHLERLADDHTHSRKNSEIENGSTSGMEKKHLCHIVKNTSEISDAVALDERETTSTEEYSCEKVTEITNTPSINKVPEPLENNRPPTEEVRGKVSTYVNPEDELEEIVPIDQLDLYIKEIQERRKSSRITPTSASKINVPEESVTSTPEKTGAAAEAANSPNEKEVCTATREKDISSIKKDLLVEDDSSFDLDISDYDSDNDNLDIELQDWQNDFDKKYNAKKDKKKKDSHPLSPKDGKSKSTSKKERFGFWHKNSPSKETTINPALQDFLEKATADAVDNFIAQ